MRFRYFLTSLFLIVLSLAASAETADSIRHWGLETTVGVSRALASDTYGKLFIKDKNAQNISLKVMKTSIPSDSDAYAQDFGYPSLGFEVRFNRSDVTMHREQNPAWGQAVPVDYISRLGNQVSFSGSFTRPIWMNRHFMLDYSMNFGVAYSHLKYDKHNNIDDELIGSRWLFYCDFGAHATWHFAPSWGLKAGLEFYHYSNGTLNRPNKGANFLGPVLGLTYMPYYNNIIQHRYDYHSPPWKKYWYLNFTVGIGAKTLDEEYQLTQFATPPSSSEYRKARFHLYTAYSLQTDLMYRYARRWASGIGFDLFYGTYRGRAAEVNALYGYSSSLKPWSFGIAAKHEIFYHQLSLGVALGAYVYRRMGHRAKELEKPFYERIGIHYTFTKLNNIQLGINVKAHLTKADFSELVVAIPIRL